MTCHLLATTALDEEFLRGLRAAAEPSGVTGGVLWSVAITAVGAAIAAWLIVGLIRRDRARQGSITRRLARSLGISPRQLRLLISVSRAAHLPNTGCLLISRGCFDAAARRYTGRFGRADRLRAIRRTVFD